MDDTVDADVLQMELRRVFAHPRERVFDAWTREEALMAWMGPSEAITAGPVSVDFREGGGYRIRFVEAGEPDKWVHGTYLTIRRPERLMFTWIWSAPVADALELPLQMEWLSFPEGEHKSARYLALNPNGKVPTLVDGDLVLWESNAINRYLCSKVPGNTLYPVDPCQRAGVDQWLAWELAHYNQALGTLAWETVAKPGFMNLPPDEAIAAWATEQLNRYAAVLEAHLDTPRPTALLASRAPSPMSLIVEPTAWPASAAVDCVPQALVGASACAANDSAHIASTHSKVALRSIRVGLTLRPLRTSMVFMIAPRLAGSSQPQA